MKRFCIWTGALLAGTLLAACGGNRGFAPPTPTEPAARTPLSRGSSSETILYRFQGGSDGEWPVVQAPLYAKGALYGTTTYGGSSTCAVNGYPAGCGTVYRIDPSGAGYKVLHRFPKSGKDGNSFFAGLSEADGVLYGTTQWGGGQGDSYPQCSGNQGCGTVFEIATSGNGYSVLNRFSGGNGMNVRPGVVDVSGIIYGAATGNGEGTSTCAVYSDTGCGLIYKLANGTETTLHTFGGSPDGYAPSSGPIIVNGTAYGTTTLGGVNNPDCISAGDGCGTIYKVGTNGQGYKVLYRFKGGKDGYAPGWGMSFANGKLYGVAVFGGDLACSVSGTHGCGTVFELNTNGTGFRTLYRFTGHSDGWFPNPLAVSGNTLYVSAEYGGASSNGCGGNGCGTVVQLSTSGKNMKVLYQFQGGNDAWYPNAVTVENGKVYGTSFWGGGTGCGGNGCGTVFEVTP